MKPNDFDMGPEAHWHAVVKTLAEAREADRLLEQFANDDSADEAWFRAAGTWDAATRDLVGHLSALVTSGTLAAITDNFPMIMGRVD